MTHSRCYAACSTAVRHFGNTSIKSDLHGEGLFTFGVKMEEKWVTKTL